MQISNDNYTDTKINVPKPKSKVKYFLCSIVSFLFIVSVFILSLFIGIFYNPSFFNLLLTIFDRYNVGFQNIEILNNNKPSINNNITNRKYINPETLSFLSKSQITKFGIIGLPENFVVHSEYKGIKFVSSPKHAFEEHHVKLIKYFLDIIPQKLIEHGPTAIVMLHRSELPSYLKIDEKTIAFASGTYIFFDENTFNPQNPLADRSVDAWFYTFVHELTHVLQFNMALDEIEKIKDSRNKNLSWLDIISNSVFMRLFASYVGWEVYFRDGIYEYTLKDKDAKTTEYGKTKIYEDMAETMAVVITDQNVARLSTERVKWVYEFLGIDPKELIINRFPIFNFAQPVIIPNLEYDYSKEVELKKFYEYVDKQFFVTSGVYKNSISKFTNEFKSELEKRNWRGSFIKSEDFYKVQRNKGFFDGVYRDVYIEIISYESAWGFEKVPDGIIIVVLSGYIPR